MPFLSINASLISYADLSCLENRFMELAVKLVIVPDEFFTNIICILWNMPRDIKNASVIIYILLRKLFQNQSGGVL